MSTIKLTVIAGPDSSTSVASEGAPLVIGRLGSCDLVLSDAQVSRRHASIALEGEEFVLVDLQSSNGTFLGDARSRISRRALRDGDSIRIGHNVLAVSIVDDEASTALAPAADSDATVTQLRPRVAVATSLVLVVLSGRDQGKIFAPQKNSVQIGRLPTCDVLLSDPGISRVHATIKREAFGFAIYDENSTNGVQVGDPPQRIFFSRLEDGMILRLSSTEVQVRISEPGRAASRNNGAGYSTPLGLASKATGSRS
jgi:pSer/pThr/pTyr-binding forkhead associated (FHA) protein